MHNYTLGYRKKKFKTIMIDKTGIIKIHQNSDIGLESVFFDSPTCIERFKN